MSVLKISGHSDVLAALDLVKEEVRKEAKRIFSAGGDALKAGKITPAKEAIAYAEKLKDFVRQVEGLDAAWSELQAGIDAAAPDVRKILRPHAPAKPHVPAKPHKAGFTRKVKKIAPKTNFSVTFPDGTVIADKKACVTLARTIEKLGADLVSTIGIQVGGEPLVTRDRSLFKKHPSAVAEIAGGWFVNTHSSTAAKIGYVKRIARAMKVKLVITNVSDDSQQGNAG